MPHVCASGKYDAAAGISHLDAKTHHTVNGLPRSQRKPVFDADGTPRRIIALRGVNRTGLSPGE